MAESSSSSSSSSRSPASSSIKKKKDHISRRKNQIDFTHDVKYIWKKASRVDKSKRLPHNLNTMFRGITDYSIRHICCNLDSTTAGHKKVTIERMHDALTMFFGSGSLIGAAEDITNAALAAKQNDTSKEKKRLKTFFKWSSVTRDTGLDNSGEKPMLSVHKMKRAIKIYMTQKRDVSDKAAMLMAATCTLFIANIMHVVPPKTELDRTKVLAAIIGHSHAFTTIIPTAKIVSMGSVTQSRIAGRKMKKTGSPFIGPLDNPNKRRKTTKSKKQKKRSDDVSSGSSFDSDEDIDINNPPPTPSF